MEALARMLLRVGEAARRAGRSSGARWLAGHVRDGCRLVAVQRRRISVCVLGVTAGALGVWILGGSGCFNVERTSVVRPPAVSGVVGREPLMRVRVGDESDRLVLAIDGPWRLFGDGDQLLADSPAPLPPTELQCSANNAWRLGASYYTSRRLDFCPRRPGSLEVNRKRYDGFLRAVGSSSGHLWAVNIVGMEDYIAGVVTAEMPANYGHEALKAQAVAARTYALWESAKHAGEEYYLSNGPEAQCYKGLEYAETANGIGRRVTRETAGLVLTYSRSGAGQLFPAYYHSTCGGFTTSVRYFKPKVEPVPPLEGGVKCDWCASSHYRNWPTVRVPKEQFWPKLVAAYPAIGGLGPADRVAVSELVVKDGHVVWVLFSGPTRTIQMLGDEFRLRVGPSLMRLTLCRIKDLGSQIELSDGHGWGHGVGMCQVGASGLAAAGYSADRILTFYYPGATICKAY